MPVEFLTDEQAAGYGRFAGEVTTAEVERFFHLDDGDRERIARRRSDSHRLGFAVQLGTVRAVGRFLEDPLDVPWAAVEFVAEQMGIIDATCVKRYVERTQTPYEHTWEIREAYGYHPFEDPEFEGKFRVFLHGRAWTHAEGPVALFDQSVAWLRRNLVLLPGVSVLARLVAAARDTADKRLHMPLARQAQIVDPLLPQRLGDLLAIPEGLRLSGLERLRRAPTRSSGPAMVKALERAEEISRLGVSRIDIQDIPANRLTVLARTGLGSKATALDRLREPKKTATLVAVVRHLEAVAIDDVLDLFALLMATRLLSPARRTSAEQRLAMLPRLEKASRTVARAGRVLLDALATAEEGGSLDVTPLWAAVEAVAPRAALVDAIGLVEALVPDDDGSADAAMRAALVGRYNTVRPFLKQLGDFAALHAAHGGRGILAAVRTLPDLARRRVAQKPLQTSDIDAELITPAWTRAVYGNPALPAGTVDRDAYVVCVLEQLHRALGRRDAFAHPSHRWADPRARLLGDERWRAVREEVLAGLSLTDPVQTHLARRVITLDAAWKQTAARLAEAGEEARVRIVIKQNGRTRLIVDNLGAQGESESLVWLRRTSQAMLPRVDLPDLLLEVHAWTGFLNAYVHLADISPRSKDLHLTVAALLVAEACNVGLTPVTQPGDPALTSGRLAHVDQYYVRAENHATANAVLIAAQAQVPIAKMWGGGLLASVDGLRFVVPVRTINAGPSPKYFGHKRGITWFNAVNDHVAGIGQMVVPGTPRDSLYILDALLNLDAGPRPEMVTTDNASYSDMVFGVFAILGYRFAPRFADLADQRYWRADLPASLPDGVELSAEQAAILDYGPLEAIARNTIHLTKITPQWPDMLRVAGSLVTNQVRAYDLLRMFGRDGHPTPLGQGFSEYGRIAKTLHLLAVVDPVDDTYDRGMNRQLTVQESRHRLARKIAHGNRGQIHQAYREGQEDQLAALGLVLNAVVLWNTRYLDAIVNDLRAKGFSVRDVDSARLSPLGHAHLNCLGRYAFSGRIVEGLRPLRDPASSDDLDSDVS
ncbi:MAG: Tn3 family transposase [Candidatus Dormibacteria bacterium]